MAKKRTGSHTRNVAPMLAAARCGAKTRRGTPCQAPAVAGKRRCRMHGGARGSGAPPGNINALKHGAYTREARAWARALAAHMRASRQLLDDIS